ncbi:integral membrane protein [Mycobacterium montefiorense]|uniref:Integral membrane protein n=1 Tax=Mycobacterium montefiorense TaxID=154654 RepID=A0AA37PNJ6_9MYCO|nr:integral membrane protein [Mycobacterium montefiorense]GKU34102.1 integral membrane protein [Mycobacterium montefiorense]GKU39671.1 integral membrane protein [Mycobacterium montefiorense]GKU47719.1 integral membrane protein [Mycobacterium montefiorense]GKU51971.1 integral membrane protein [Mycobacterium montefiorense]
MFQWFVHRVAHWFSHDIVHGGRLPLLCCLVAFILTFFVTRTFVRFIRHRVDSGLPARWWQPRNVHIGGLHIHHVTFGVVLVMISGLTLVTLSDNGQEPENTVSAIFFGIGAALVLDEYALILHLSDVYWEEDGRSSVDAVFAAVAVAGLLIMGLHPLMFFFPFTHGTDTFAWRVAVIGAMVMTLPLAVVVLLKGKVWTGLLGMFLVVLLVIGAIRLSRPHAPWARWRYTAQPDKMRRALQRERKWRRPVVRAKLWLQCAIAGTPRLPDDRMVDAQLDQDVHPAPPPEGTEPILVGRYLAP